MRPRYAESFRAQPDVVKTALSPFVRKIQRQTCPRELLRNQVSDKRQSKPKQNPEDADTDEAEECYERTNPAGLE